MDDQNQNRLNLHLFQFLKFHVVGISNTAITYGLYSLIVYLSDSHQLALVCDYGFGIVYTFLMNKYITFKNYGSGEGWKQFTKIFGMYIIVFALNWIILDRLITIAQWNKYIAQAVTLVVLSMLSFFGQKFLVFRSRDV